MSFNSISRASLQAMPGQVKQKYIDSIIDAVVTGVTNAANTGKISYMYDINNIGINSINSCGLIQIHEHNIIENKTPYKPTITIDELVGAIKIKFPDCDISYQEINPDTKVLKKGIVIDWS